MPTLAPHLLLAMSEYAVRHDEVDGAGLAALSLQAAQLREVDRRDEMRVSRRMREPGLVAGVRWFRGAAGSKQCARRTGTT